MRNFVEIKFDEKSTEREFLTFGKAYDNSFDNLECYCVELGVNPDDYTEGYHIDEFYLNGKRMYAFNLDRFDDAGNITDGYIAVFTSNKKRAQAWARYYGYKSKEWFDKKYGKGAIFSGRI